MPLTCVARLPKIRRLRHQHSPIEREFVARGGEALDLAAQALASALERELMQRAADRRRHATTLAIAGRARATTIRARPIGTTAGVDTAAPNRRFK